MSEVVAGIYTIGQTPRPDLTETLSKALGSVRLEIRGAIDGLAADRLPPVQAGGYPLETRLRDGSRVVLDAEFLEPRLQSAINELDGRVRAHLVMCAGPFPGLRARQPLVRPFDFAVAELSRRGVAGVELVVPFVAQAEPAARKWRAAGLRCRTHVMAERPQGRPVGGWLGERTARSSADAVVFDYVGFPAAILTDVRATVGVPVLDVGRLAIDELARLLRHQ